MSLLIDPYRFAAPAGYASEVLADSPSAYWKLDETSGSTAADSSGNARDLAKGSAVTVNAAAVRTGATNSYDFPGANTNSNLNHADDTWLSPHAGASGLMTLEGWFNIDTLAAINTLFSKGTASQLEYTFGVSTGGALQFNVFTLLGVTVAAATSAGGAIVVGTDYHLAATFDRAGNFAKVYKNGVEVGTTTTAVDSADGTSAFRVGYRLSGGDRFLNGRASDLAIYPTALSATRLLAHYNAG